MITSLLHACGLDLGPEKDFLPPAPNNPEGFWESRSFLRLNDAILKELGGSWDSPPRPLRGKSEIRISKSESDIGNVLDFGFRDSDFPRSGWHRLRKRAKDLLARFAGREPWGWKDPRNCLTLPFWRKLLPEVRVLVCVRNPLAVAESLRRRNGIPYTDSFALWLTYNRRVLAAAPAACRLVTHCDTYLHDPHAELCRVLQWAGLPATEEQIECACQRITPSLLHHRMTLDDLAEAGASVDLLRCYQDLCEEAGRGEPAALAAG